ncbi:hypothetical protein A6A04_09860 [Paramagnetospirillum marisnigri]|uniref:Addiction module protein n=1 Tax=Paramagnetospirillum marisnigri TaxID=1285242 RepID=A0A178M4K8_9PROT|nr:addiction module protein [Paramagnetospirillum marisnigri]OAN42996.1 hypothetical protein A6A04_09860 [Paramagnetospirillum marisnigri]
MPTLAFEHLSAEQRLALIGELWESLESPAVPVTPAQQAELDRRLESVEQDLAQAVPWEAFRADLSKRLT